MTSEETVTDSQTIMPIMLWLHSDIFMILDILGKTQVLSIYERGS